MKTNSVLLFYQFHQQKKSLALFYLWLFSQAKEIKTYLVGFVSAGKINMFVFTLYVFSVCKLLAPSGAIVNMSQVGEESSLVSLMLFSE